MTSYTWRTGSGAFDNPSSWTPSSVPTAGDTALFTANGGTVSSTGSVSTLEFLGAVWTLVGQVSADTAIVNAAGLYVAGNGADLLVNQSLSVGLGSNTALVVTNYGGLTDAAAPGAGSALFGAASLTLGNRAQAVFSGNVSMGVNGLATAATVDAALLAIGGTLVLGAGGSPSTGSASVTVQDSGILALTGAGNSAYTTPLLQLGAQAATAGAVYVTGSGSLLLASNNSTTVGVNGTGTLSVSSGGAARFGSANNGLAPALTIAAAGSAIGNVYVGGAGSLLAASGSILVGSYGGATLSIAGGAHVTAAAPTALGSSFSVAANAGSDTVGIDGSGTSLAVSGSAMVGGDDRGGGAHAGGLGTVSVTNGATMQVSTSLTVFAGSRIGTDGASTLAVGGNLLLGGTVASYGALSVGGAVAGSGTLQLGGASVSLGGIAGANLAFTGAPVAYIQSVTGSNTISGLGYSNRVDLVGITGASLGNNEVFLGNGATIVLTGAAAGTKFALASDGNGGTQITVTPKTLGVYRFFDSSYGTHFFTSSSAEESQIAATRPDLVYEGVGLDAVDPASNDPNAAPVYRFFDSSYGTHFFTASSAERDTVIASRPDLVYEGTGFYEHTAAQPGDVPVFRFFDSSYGTHFYTADPSERATIVATRPDLVDEGIGFYAPG